MKSKIVKAIVFSATLFSAAYFIATSINLRAQETFPATVSEETPIPTETPFTSTPTPNSIQKPEQTDTPIGSPTPNPTALPTATPNVYETATPSPSTMPEAVSTSTPNTDIEPSATPTPHDLDTKVSSPEQNEPIENTDTDKSQPTPTQTIIEQNGTTTSQTYSSSSTGGNTQSSQDKSQMTTGNATSVSNSIIVVNMSDINSNLITCVKNILNSDKPDINLYKELLDAIAANPNSIPDNSSIVVTQNAKTQSTAISSASTGQNLQISYETNLTTGDAVSISNAITAANLNFVGSNAILAIVNILENYDGDIILPNGELVSQVQQNERKEIKLNVVQNSNISGQIESIAATGSNIQSASGSSNLITGNSASSSNSLVISDLTQVFNGLRYLLINNYGSWNGSLQNWQNPGSTQTFANGSFTLTGYNYPTSSANTAGSTSIESFQDAEIKTTVVSRADSGSNIQSANTASMNTGNSKAVANNLTLANITSVGSNLFLGIVNILGRWRGNIIAAYPEIKVTITDNMESINPGMPVTYWVTVENIGKAKAGNVILSITWPDKITPDYSVGSNIQMGDLYPGEIRIFSFKGSLQSNLTDGEQLLTQASISTTDTQSSSEFNLATDTTYVEIPEDPPADTRIPDIQLSIWNNSGEFIFPGDTLLVKVLAKNNSPFPAKNVKIVSGIGPKPWQNNYPMGWELGIIRPNGIAEISFDVNLNGSTREGIYTISAKAFTESDSGNKFETPAYFSDFNVKSRVVKISNSTEGNVLGTNTMEDKNKIDFPATTTNIPKPSGPVSNYPYILILVIFIYIVLRVLKMKIQGKPVIPPAWLNFVKRNMVRIAGTLTVITLATLIFLKKIFIKLPS